MSNDNNNKSESVNFENEQFGQRTLNSDEERQIKKSEEMKLSSTSNKYLSKTTKFKKTKSQNRYNKMKLPQYQNQKKRIFIHLKEKIQQIQFSQPHIA